MKRVVGKEEGSKDGKRGWETTEAHSGQLEKGSDIRGKCLESEKRFLMEILYGNPRALMFCVQNTRRSGKNIE